VLLHLMAGSKEGNGYSVLRLSTIRCWYLERRPGGSQGDRGVLSALTVFTKQNDPYEERDCASFMLNGQCFFWMIDYYDETCTYRSRDPCGDVTTRALTLMLAQDY